MRVCAQIVIDICIDKKVCPLGKPFCRGNILWKLAEFLQYKINFLLPVILFFLNSR
jgi:hypothetical protein